MTEAFKHRDVAAPRVAEEVPAVVHHNGDRHGHHHDHHHPSLARRGLSAAACCCRCRARSGSSRRRERRCCPSLLPLFSRKNTRHFSALVLLFLAGTFSLRGWRASMMIDSTPLGVGRWSTSSAGLAKDQRSQCEWEPGGPVMFDVRHSKTHADAGHWFHVAECFIGRRQDFKDHISGMDGTDVYLKDSDVAWNSRLTPMSRLFMIAGLTSVGVRSVHFVDGNHASFSFPPSPSSKKEGGGDEATGASTALRGGDSHAGATPQPGQVGMLRLDDVGHSGQFVVSPDQPLPHRLTVSAPVSPVRRWDERGGRDGGARVGGGGATCVKFAGTVGDQDQDREQTRSRPDWFTGEEGPRELLRALDYFCPISWLRQEQQQRALAIDDGAVPAHSGEGGSGSGGNGRERRRVSRGLYATVVGGPLPGQGARGGLGFGAGVKQVIAKSKKLVIYQREDGRQLLKSDKLADELWDRMGHLGWKITEIVHDDQRHPCDLVEELAGADVLLTAHGFQSMLSVFMPPGSVLFEVYPHKYFQAGHAPLLQSLGLRYDFSESAPRLLLTSWSWPSRETCMRWYWCRWYVRRSNVIIDEDSVEVLISYMLKSLRGR